MKLKEGWLEPIILLEKEVERLEAFYNLDELPFDITATEKREFLAKKESIIYPYRKLLLHAKYLGYEFTQDERVRNTLNPLFKF